MTDDEEQDQQMSDVTIDSEEAISAGFAGSELLAPTVSDVRQTACDRHLK